MQHARDNGPGNSGCDNLDLRMRTHTYALRPTTMYAPHAHCASLIITNAVLPLIQFSSDFVAMAKNILVYALLLQLSFVVTNLLVLSKCELNEQ